jgi:single-strand DNA-binding protein
LRYKFAEANQIEFDRLLNSPARAQKIIIMNNLRNRVQLIGHLGMDPEIKNLEQGKKLARFSLATNEIYTNSKGEKITDTEWHYVVAWNKTAELVEQYLVKGKEVAVEGKLSTRSWEDEQGNKKYATEIVCNEVLFLGKKVGVNDEMTK